MGEVRLAELLREHARERAEETALVYEDRRLTFAELDERTNRLAQALAAEGVEAGDRVAHLDQNAPECVELLFAAAKLGAVLVPLNWRLARPELETIVEDAEPKVIICGPDFDGDGLAGKVVATGDDYEDWLGGHDADDPGHEAGEDDVAFQLYTSGTTGKPKGVLTTNGNLDGLTKVSDAWDLDGDSVALVAMPLFHIGGLGWLLVAFAQGAQSVLIRKIDPDELLETMASEQITNAFLVPTVLGMLCDVDGAADRDWSQLRSIAYGASPITTTVLKKTLKTFGCPLFQVYGLTETTGAIVQLDASDHDPDGPREHLLRSAGKPYDWMEVRIIDPESGDERDAGEVGEVLVRGASVMAGYYDNEEETKAALDDDGWLHTGDGGCVDEEGYLFLSDRIKDMIVSGGENVLSGRSGGGAVLLRRHRRGGGGRPARRQVGRGGDRGGRGRRRRGRRRVEGPRARAVAGYKLPRRIVQLDELPKTPTGKVLKRELRDDLADD